MKKVVLFYLHNHTLTNEKLIDVINNNVYDISEFATTDEYRCGFTPVHDKINNLYIDGENFVKAKFKIAVRTYNKKMLKDLVKARQAELEAKNLEFDKISVTAAIQSKLLAKGDYKFSTFDIIFDTKNNRIYTDASAKSFEDNFIKFFKKINDKDELSMSFVMYRPKFDGRSLARFFTNPEEHLNEHINVGNYVQILKNDGTTVTFEDAELYEDESFCNIKQNDTFTVQQIKITYQPYGAFRINKKFLPVSICVFNRSTDGESEETAQDTADANQDSNMTKEKALYDALYTSAFVELDSLEHIAKFTYDFELMESVIESMKR